MSARAVGARKPRPPRVAKSPRAAVRAGATAVRGAASSRRRRLSGEVTVGIDIGTTSVKALAVDADGNVLARTRVPHEVRVTEPDTFEHDPTAAWYHGPRTALAKLDLAPGGTRGIGIAGMVPSLTAVDATGRPVSPGLLYGDRRGQTGQGHLNPLDSGEGGAFLAWTAERWPDVHGYWPAQAVGGAAIGGAPVIDVSVAMSYYPLHDGTEWDASRLADIGVRPEQMPRVLADQSVPAAWVGDTALVAGGVDSLAEQICAGADEAGDVLVICGTTLITWATVSEYREVAGLWSFPHSARGLFLLGGPSNAGGLFLGWARRLLGKSRRVLDPERVPVWTPYVRGERTPLHDTSLRATLHGLDLTHDAATLRRAAYEAAGFVVRHHLDLAGCRANRIVVTGGGVRDKAWIQALADCTGLPVDCVAVPEGAALGMAWFSRMAAGLEDSVVDARRWARTGRRVEPDEKWVAACTARYERFLELSRHPCPAGVTPLQSL